MAARKRAAKFRGPETGSGFADDGWKKVEVRAPMKKGCAGKRDAGPGSKKTTRSEFCSAHGLDQRQAAEAARITVAAGGGPAHHQCPSAWLASRAARRIARSRFPPAVPCSSFLCPQARFGKAQNGVGCALVGSICFKVYGDYGAGASSATTPWQDYPTNNTTSPRLVPWRFVSRRRCASACSKCSWRSSSRPRKTPCWMSA